MNTRNQPAQPSVARMRRGKTSPDPVVKTMSVGVPGHSVYKTNVFFMILNLFYSTAQVKINVLSSTFENQYNTNVFVRWFLCKTITKPMLFRWFLCFSHKNQCLFVDSYELNARTMTPWRGAVTWRFVNPCESLWICVNIIVKPC